MNRRCAFTIAVAILCLVTGLGLWAQERALNRMSPGGADVVLAVFDPEVFNIKALAALRTNGILDVPGLTVVGIYHVKQTGNFEEARKYVADNHLDWFTFHAVSAEISESDVFRKNACTPEFEAIVAKADGVIFFGGPDIPPAVYHRKTSLMTSIEDPCRHYLEASAVFHFLGGSQDENFRPLLDARPGFPILGICLGLQTLNVGTGGTLIQDIWTDVYGSPTVEEAITLGPEQWHNNPYRKLFPLPTISSYNFHSLRLLPESLFCTSMGFKETDHPRILSSHHQAVNVLGKGLYAVATSRDGKIVEAVQHRKYPNVLGLQFHPEHPMLWDTQPRYRIKPADLLTSYNAILAGAPPSLAFNKAIWAWLAGRLEQSHGRQKAPAPAAEARRP